ncbi:MAG: mercury transporter MerT [Hyphomicrobiales bacterium]|nr:MAG: mercury transporter MerT [Hyphomicrobiales bacterium]
MTARDELATPPSAVGTRKRFDVATLLSVGGILAALGAASCCVLPFALFLAGISGAWIGNLTALEPYQPVFAAVSLGFIGYGAWRVYRKPKVACADGYCATQRSDRIAKIGLWTAAILVVIAVGFPYAIRYVLVS